ncbi:MAG: serine protease [Nitrospinae bacterium CG11_big_fil_rev_8_21_14_0_20_56_8]|nr:MAG: serine protease [Nitrospinae bacterium CG11_big_fil_rev_8_21_14_0_20_56_8]
MNPDKFFAPALLIFLTAIAWPLSAGAQGRVIVVPINGAINPVVADFVSEEIREANLNQEELLVIQMDTPGGLDTAMRQIIKAIQDSRVPIAVFVGPSGSRAASAGTFITLASHVAAMAPGTNIGAAHPVNLMGGGGGDEQSKTMEEKVANDAAAYIRSLAEQRGRNAYWAEMAVRKSQSISAEEAKKLGVIDLIANDLAALILAVEGREVTINSVPIVIHTEGREISHREMTQRQKILDIISNPNVAYILMMLGLVGLYFELSNPGLILPGVIGGISLILALYAMQTLPINYAGLLLILLGIVLFIAEINVMSFGLLAVGGGISILLGSLMLMDTDDPALQISKSVLIPTAAFFLLVVVGIIYLARQSHKMKSVAGWEALIGAVGVVKAEIDPEGTILVHGEIWNAESEQPVPVGEKVTVEAIDGLKVKVKRLEQT